MDLSQADALATVRGKATGDVNRYHPFRGCRHNVSRVRSDESCHRAGEGAVTIRTVMPQDLIHRTCTRGGRELVPRSRRKT